MESYVELDSWDEEMNKEHVADKECCGNCHFAKPRADNLKQIDCFRYPAQVTAHLTMTSNGPAPVYLNATPVMEGDDWCGEFKRKEKKLVA